MTNPSSLPAVIFDLDGTLIDSAGDIHAAANLTLEEAGEKPMSRKLVQSFVGNGVPVLVRRMLTHLGAGEDDARHAALLDRFLHHYAGSHALTVLYPGVAEALRELQAAGHPLGLCTNKPEAPARAILARLGIEAFFSAVIGGDSLPQRKPDPAPLLATAKLLGAEQVIFVGDSEVDAQTAVNAALPFALYTKGYRKSLLRDLSHQGRFSDFARLGALVARMSKAI